MQLPSDSELASLALTHVYYDPNDILGLPSAFLALLPQALVIAYLVTIYARREIEVTYMFLGQLSCEALNWALKRIIKQDRPSTVLGIGKGYGMPSSHSQFMAFFGTYTVLYLAYRCINSRVSWRLLRAIVVLAVSIAVCLSRIYLTYHTSSQVSVGALIGMVYGLGWFVSYGILSSYGIVDWILDLSPVQYFWFKDTVIDDALPQEWRLWKVGRVAHSKKSS